MGRGDKITRGGVTHVDFGGKKGAGLEHETAGREVRRVILEMLLQIGLVHDTLQVQFTPDGEVQIPGGLEQQMKTIDDPMVRELLQGQLDKLKELTHKGYDPSND